MLTPIDIQNVEFSKAFNGYSKTEVDEFLARLQKDYESLYKDSVSNKDKIAMLSDSVREYKSMEEALKNTLMFAQNTAEDVKKSAQDKADAIIAQAKQDADKIIFEAEQKTIDAKRELENVRSLYVSFKNKFDNLLDLYKKQIREIESEDQVL